MKIDKGRVHNILELVCRYYVFFFLNFYALGKIAGGQFYRRGELPDVVANTTLESATAFEIAWTFMGFSFIYILFIGVSQLIGSWMLLWNRTKLLGVGILIPIMLNIIVFDIIFLDNKGAIVNASIYFFMLLAILYFNKSKVILAFQSLTMKIDRPKQVTAEQIKTLLLVGLTMIIVFGIDQFLVGLIGR